MVNKNRQHDAGWQVAGEDIRAGHSVKAREFSYARARSLDEALALLARPGEDARIIAGGQSLVPALNLRLAAPGCLVDIGAIEALRGIRVLPAEEGRPERLLIGALVRHVELQRSAAVARLAPLLTEAVRHVAHAAIRNRGTFGGSIAHADPASEFPACVLALGGRMHVAARGGHRVVEARDFFLGLHETAVAPGEILAAVEIDGIAAGWRSGFAELSRRAGDYAMVGLALHGLPVLDPACPGRTRFAAAMPVFFSVGDRPMLASEAAAVLCDPAVADGDRLHLAGEALGRDLRPAATPALSADACLHLARVLLARVAARLLAPEERPVAA